MDIIIFLDMDGVLCDWAAGVCELFGKDVKEVLNQWKPTDHPDISPYIKMSQDEMWDGINKKGSEFWSSLKPYPWARRLYETCQSLGDVYFLSSPSDHSSSLAGKLDWIKKFTGNPTASNYSLTANKYQSAAHGRILIDDSEKHVKKFREFGGYSICFPQRWNSQYKFSHIESPYPDTYVLADLEKHIASLEK